MQNTQVRRADILYIDLPFRSFVHTHDKKLNAEIHRNLQTSR